MNTFEDLGLAEPILRAVSAEGYTNPTPIQAAAIPELLNGRDVIGVAQTGTGKTASFVLPMLHQITFGKRRAMPKMCNVLILSPTRELSAQIVENINKYACFTKISSTLIVGGVSPRGQIRALNAGVDIVVATPGRLLDHLNNGAIMLAKTQALVIDEADQMLDLGFLPDIRRIVSRLPSERQTALLSATMPGQIRKLADDLLTSPAEITIAAVSRPVERIVQSVRHVEKSDKRRVLTEILSDKQVERTVVFTRTKRGADRVCKQLVASNLNAAAIHGNKSQGQRERTMAAFRSGKASILVATDIAARGIDIDDVSHVVNFELPNVPESYVHRIGRTARAGRSGVAISLCDPSETKLLRDIEKLIGSRLECGDAKIAHPSRAKSGERRTKPCRVPSQTHQSPKNERPPQRVRAEPKQPRHHDERQPSEQAPRDGLMRMLGNIGQTPSPVAF